jgi:hypothetical protein
VTSKTIFGRAWFYDTGDAPEFDTWEHEFEPMELHQRSGAEWAHEFLVDGPEDELRDLFEIPKTGSFQVLFKGSMCGDTVRTPDCPGEWEEWFDVEEMNFIAVPKEWVNQRLDVHEEEDDA